jgi:hypothetical protein
LAMLLPMTSRFAAATLSPLMPWEKAMCVPWLVCEGGG